ncbi:hypothetical protein TNCV_1977421, partial [Trichonephila clavipes]
SSLEWKAPQEERSRNFEFSGFPRGNESGKEFLPTATPCVMFKDEAPETFRQEFMKHQRIPARSWRDFVFEITSCFEEWLDGMEAVIVTQVPRSSVVRADVVEGQSVDSGGTIQIMSAFLGT